MNQFDRLVAVLPLTVLVLLLCLLVLGCTARIEVVPGPSDVPQDGKVTWEEMPIDAVEDYKFERPIKKDDKDKESPFRHPVAGASQE